MTPFDPWITALTEIYRGIGLRVTLRTPAGARHLPLCSVITLLLLAAAASAGVAEAPGQELPTDPLVSPTLSPAGEPCSNNYPTCNGICPQIVIVDDENRVRKVDAVCESNDASKECECIPFDPFILNDSGAVCR